MRDVYDKEEIDRLIAEWYRVAIGVPPLSTDVFFRFVAVWVAFNALYSSRMYEEVGDWNQIRAYAGDPDVIDRHRKLLENDSDYALAVKAMSERGVFDTSTSARRWIHDPRNLTQVASCLYQVRCNLFHGGKAPTNLRDQKLVSSAYKVVSTLIGPDIGISSDQQTMS